MSKQDIEKRLGFAAKGVKKVSTDFDLEEACWEGYEAVGTKKKDGKTVPNCVPKNKAARLGVKAKFATPEQIKERYKQLRAMPKQRLFDIWTRETLGRIHNADIKEQDKLNMAVDLIRSEYERKDWEAAGFRIVSSRSGAKANMATGEPDLRSFRLPGEIAAVRKKIDEYTKALNNDLRSGKYTNAAARCKAIGAMYSSGGGSLSSFYDEYADALKNRGYARSGAKAKMSKATDALAFIKSSIESGKTVYIQTPRGATKVTPKTYAKFEALGRPLFKIGTDGALLMSSGSSYNRLTMGEEEMLVRVSAMSRPGVKAKA